LFQQFDGRTLKNTIISS